VDICWRLMDANYDIGFAGAAMVWHHRRNTVKAYLSQQKGYGRAEAMLLFKHPQRFNRMGCSRWRGVIYGEGAVGLPLLQPAIYHGTHGNGLFQTIYQSRDYTFWAYVTTLEWHLIALFILSLAIVLPPMAVVSGVMWVLTAVAGWRALAAAPIKASAPWWCRPLVYSLGLIQPVSRAWHRYKARMERKRPLPLTAADFVRARRFKAVSAGARAGYWTSDKGRGREQLLDALGEHARRLDMPGILDHAWDSSDMSLFADRWVGVTIHSATETLGASKRFTRIRCSAAPTAFARCLGAAILVWSLISAACLNWIAASIGVLLLGLLMMQVVLRRRRVLIAITAMIDRAAAAAILKRVWPEEPGKILTVPAATPRRLPPPVAPSEDDEPVQVDVA
jgi:hypothetical protein